MIDLVITSILLLYDFKYSLLNSSTPPNSPELILTLSPLSVVISSFCKDPESVELTLNLVTSDPFIRLYPPLLTDFLPVSSSLICILISFERSFMIISSLSNNSADLLAVLLTTPS